MNNIFYNESVRGKRSKIKGFELRKDDRFTINKCFIYVWNEIRKLKKYGYKCKISFIKPFRWCITVVDDGSAADIKNYIIETVIEADDALKESGDEE